MNGAQSQDGLDDRLEQVSSIPLTCCPHANLDAEVGHLQPKLATLCARLGVPCALNGPCSPVGLPGLTLSPWETGL